MVFYRLCTEMKRKRGGNKGACCGLDMVSPTRLYVLELDSQCGGVKVVEPLKSWEVMFR